MCGRYTLTRSAGELVETFDVPDLAFDYQPCYNIAPGRAVPVLAEDKKGRRIGPLIWGFIPSWSKQPGKAFINARAETVAHTPSFRDSFARRRCLIPADGFFEWRKDGAAKTPFWFHTSDAGLFTMAGIWDHWAGPDEEPRYTFAILTTEANADVSDVHDRMPVVVDAQFRDAWLGRDASVDEAMNVLAPKTRWLRREVGPRVGSPRNNDPSILDPV